MRGMLGAFAGLLMMLVSGEAQAAKLIAVLPLDVSNTKGKLDRAAQASLEEMLRDVATNALRPRGWTILSGENTIQVLIDNGVKPEECGSQSCHLANARELKAEAFISGTVQHVEGEFIASIRLIETKTGSLLTSERIRAKTVNALVEAFEGKAEAFFTKAGLLDGAAPPPPPRETTAPPVVDSSQPQVKKSKVTEAVGSLTVTAKPKDAVRLELVDPDGKKLATGVPYESKTATPGRWKVIAKASRYEEEEQTVDVQADDLSVVKFDLKLLGALSVTGEPAGSAVVVTGPGGFKDDGGLPWEASGLKGGTYQVKVTRKGYADANETVTVAPGKTATVRVALQKGASGTKVEPKSGLEFVALPGGTFLYGCEAGDSECDKGDKFPRSATVRPFSLGKTEVTVEAYARCVNAGVCGKPNTGGACNWGVRGREKHPINCVDWKLAKQFCGWIDGRLPTTEEWEYAAKGGENRIYPWGNNGPTATVAKFESSEGTVTVATYGQGTSKHGLMDMAGNVWEWTDFYGSDSGGELRGGGWSSPARHLRASNRTLDKSGAGDGYSSAGFRCGL